MILPKAMLCAMAMAAVILDAQSIPMDADAAWTRLCPGVEYAQFDACTRSPKSDSKITVVRVDPAHARLRLLSSAGLGLPHPLRADAWAARFDLAVVINAGMFGPDSRHLGYMKIGAGDVNNAVVRRDYKSVLAFDPRGKLPLELVAAQHLEGGGAAALVIRTPALHKVLFVGYETTPEGRETDQGDQGSPLPNVLAVTACR